ncbi:nucleotidyltransferase family protein [soil metagenome]
MLGGGGGGDALASAAGVATKALVPLGGKPLGAYVLAALQKSLCVGHFTYVGTCAGLEPHLGVCDVCVPAGTSLSHSLALGLGSALAQKPTRLLVLSADIPWVTPQALDRFVTDAPAADLVYPVIPQKVAEARFPGQKRTYAAVREGRFTGGNMTLLTPDAVGALLGFMDRLYEGRKNPLTLASIFGLNTAFRLLAGRVTIPELETRATKLLGVSARAYISPDASLGADVDKQEHLRAAVADLG